MVRRAIVLTALSIAVCAQAGIDLRPQPSTFELEGVKIPNVAFRYDEAVVTYSPPEQWRLDGTESDLQLIPKGGAQTEARITRVEGVTDPFSEKAIAALKKQIITRLPEGASAVTWDEDRENPLSICGRETYEVQLSYSAFGKRFRTSVLVCALPREQLHFRVIAPEATFSAVYEEFRQSLYTLAGLD